MGELGEQKSNDSKKLFILGAIIALYIVATNVMLPQGLTVEGWKALVLMVCTVLLWMTEVVPIGIISCLVVFLPQLLGIQSSVEVLKEFANPTVFFIMSAIIIAQVFVDTGLGYRVSLYITTMFGKKSKNVILSYMVCSMVISFFLVDIPTIIIVSGIALSVLEKADCKPGKSNFGKAIMLGIPIAAALGGFGTPAGSGINLLAINLMENVAGVSINFLQWTAIGAPMSLLLTVIAWFIITKIFPPEMEEVPGMDEDNIKSERAKLGSLSRDEKKFMGVFSITIILWFTQPLTGIETAFSSLLATTIFCLPGIDLMDWERAEKTVPWDTILLVGSCNAMAMILANQGSAQWISDTFLSGFANSSLLVLLFAVTTFGIFIHLLVPLSGAVLSLCIPIVTVLANNAGVNPLYLILPLAYTASCVFLLPLDPITLATYGFGYWDMIDCPKVGFPIAIAWIPIAVGLIFGAIQIGII